MGTVFKKTATKPLPDGAKIIVRKGQRFAEWIDAKQKRRTAPVTVGQEGTDRLVITAKTYTAKYRDGAGIVREVATGCRDETAARGRLAELERRAELVKAKVITSDEDAVSDCQQTLLADHIAAFIDHQKAKGVVALRVSNTLAQLRQVAADCRFSTLADMEAGKLERWLLDRQAGGMSAGTRNQYRAAWVTFGNWCIAARPPRLLSNPFAKVPKADEKADPRRKRRALTEDELRRLLDVARRRPLAEYGRSTVRKAKDGPKRKRDTWNMLPLEAEDLDAATNRARERLAKNPALVAEMEALGRERALIYKALVLTGLRKGELASLTVGQLVLDADPPFLTLDAADEKNRQGSTIPLRADLAEDLRQWLADKAKAVQSQAKGLAGHVLRLPTAGGAPCEAWSLPPDTRLFDVPHGLVKILDRDLLVAGIARRVESSPGKWKIDKRDERGRTVDVHALRHTFGTLLSKGGVAPRTAQAAMRHSTIDLTMNVYTDPRLLDVAGAMEALPALPLGTDSSSTSAAMKATGTDESTSSRFAPGFARNIGDSRKLGSIRDRQASWEDTDSQRQETQKTAEKHGVSSGFLQWALVDSNHRPLPCEDTGSASECVARQDVAPTPSPVCTRVCTSEAENAHADAPADADLALIIERWPRLPADVRRRVLRAVQTRKE